MENRFYLKLSFNIVAVFTVVIFMSFIPSLAPNFFGDWLCEGSTVEIVRHPVYSDSAITKSFGCDYSNYSHSPAWHWGYQHWLFFIMGILLFIVQAIRIINLIDKFSKNGQ